MADYDMATLSFYEALVRYVRFCKAHGYVVHENVEKEAHRYGINTDGLLVQRPLPVEARDG